MFTFSSFVASAQGRIQPWEPLGSGLAWRMFYYSQIWRAAVNNLSARSKAGLVSPASDQARVLGVVERFVVGDPKAQLVRPYGDGSYPPLFRRMRRPNECVVEMRTTATRTFGFFISPNVYAALFLSETKLLKQRAPGQGDPYLPWAAKVQSVIQHISDVDCTTDVEQLVTNP